MPNLTTGNGGVCRKIGVIPVSDLTNFPQLGWYPPVISQGHWQLPIFIWFYMIYWKIWSSSWHTVKLQEGKYGQLANQSLQTWRTFQSREPESPGGCVATNRAWLTEMLRRFFEDWWHFLGIYIYIVGYTKLSGNHLICGCVKKAWEFSWGKGW